MEKQAKEKKDEIQKEYEQQIKELKASKLKLEDINKTIKNQLKEANNKLSLFRGTATNAEFEEEGKDLDKKSSKPTGNFYKI